MPNSSDVVALARSWLGTKWVHQGRSREGIDCAGLVAVVGNELGLVDYDSTNYQRRTNGHAFLHHFQENMTRLPIAEARPGDVLLFRDAAFPCHSSIVGERDGTLTIIHSHAPRRKVVEDPLNQGDWLQRCVACFRFHQLVGD